MARNLSEAKRMVEEVFGATEVITEEEWNMGLLDDLRASGFKPEANSDGEWQPYKGTYKVRVEALRPEKQEDGTQFVQEELSIVEVIDGDAKRETKYADFRRRYYLDGDKAADNLKKMLNSYFTWGVELDASGDENKLFSSFGEAIGKEGFIRAWGWKPENKDQTYQQYTFLKEAVGEKKKAKGNTVPF